MSEDSRTPRELRERIDGLRERSDHPPLPDDRLGEIYEGGECRARPDPNAAQQWVIDTEDGIFALGTLAEGWTATVSEQDPDHVIGDGEE